MADPTRRLLHLLIDPTMSDREFDRLARLLDSPQVLEILEEAYSIRQRVRRKNSSRDYSTRAIDISAHGHPLEEIERILRIDAELGAADAVHLMSIELADPEIRYSKRSFADEIRAMLRNHSLSKVLSAAHRVRSRISHSSSPDWPLSD